MIFQLSLFLVFPAHTTFLLYSVFTSGRCSLHLFLIAKPLAFIAFHGRNLTSTSYFLHLAVSIIRRQSMSLLDIAWRCLCRSQAFFFPCMYMCATRLFYSHGLSGAQRPASPLSPLPSVPLSTIIKIIFRCCIIC